MHWIAPQKFTLNRWCILSRLRPGKSASSWASSSSFSRLREARTTWARRRANSRAVSRPIPDDAPVMITARPSTCNRPSSNGAHAEPLRELRPEAEPGVASGDQAHVSAFQDDVFRILRAQQGRQRLRRGEGGDVIVLGHDVQRRARYPRQVHPPATEGKLPLHQLVLPHQLLDQLAVRFAGERYLLVHPAKRTAS